MTPRYPVKKIIARALDAAREAGLEIGGVDVRPDGTVRVLTREAAKEDAFAEWKRRAANG